MFIIFLQQVLSGRLLFAVFGRLKSNLSNKFKLKLITIYYLQFVMKIL